MSNSETPVMGNVTPLLKRIKLLEKQVEMLEKYNKPQSWGDERIARYDSYGQFDGYYP